MTEIVGSHVVAQLRRRRARRHASAHRLRATGAPVGIVNTSPSSPTGNSARCAASMSVIVSGTGMVRTPAACLGCAERGGALHRHHLAVDPNRAPQKVDSVDGQPETLPAVRPVDAITYTAERRRSGISAAIVGIIWATWPTCSGSTRRSVLAPTCTRAAGFRTIRPW